MKKLNNYQQLRIIEGLTLAYENGEMTVKIAKKVIDDIYKIAHLNGTCENEHEDWHKEGFELIKEFKKYGISGIGENLEEDMLKHRKLMEKINGKTKKD